MYNFLCLKLQLSQIELCLLFIHNPLSIELYQNAVLIQVSKKQLTSRVDQDGKNVLQSCDVHIFDNR